MSTKNNIQVAGFLPKDATSKQFTNNKVYNFTIGVSSFEGEGEKREKNTAFIAVKIWGKNITDEQASILKKGALVQLSGKLSVNAWKDGEQKRTALVIIADSVELVTKEDATEETQE